MSTKTGIQWTDATWNPIRGCSRVSEGCRNCYAERDAHRFGGEGRPFEGLTSIVNGKAVWNGKIRFVEEHLLDPLKWKPVFLKCEVCGVTQYQCLCEKFNHRPRRIFVNSMSDLFHENVTDQMLDKIFAVMALCPQHTFQVLTKRPERMLAYLSDPLTQKRVERASVFIIPNAEMSANGIEPKLQQEAMEGWAKWPLPNVWPGVSVENQKTADERIPLLLQTAAAKRFISAEPLLGAVDLTRVCKVTEDYEFGPETWFRTALEAGDIWHTEGGETSDGPDSPALDWVIVGGESGPGARPMHPDWASALRDQCVAAGVPFFFKQWGEWAPGAQQADYSRKGTAFTRIDVAGNPSNDPTNWLASDALFYRVGKKAAGRLLDGREWNEMPGVQRASL